MATLFMVATPIGNLKDITLRALETLRQVQFIACEDTRHTRKLLTAYEISAPMISCRSQNEAAGAEKIVQLLDQGSDGAYVSDAGTPAFSDPGRLLTAKIIEKEHLVIPIPGPSALGALVSVCGTPGASVLFEGFLPLKTGKKRKRIESLLLRQEDFVFFESPYRIVKLLQLLADIDAERYIIIGREMTKHFEEYLRGTVRDVLKKLEQKDKIKGEFTVFVSGKKSG